MTLLEKTLTAIKPRNKEIEEKILKRFEKFEGEQSLGKLKDMVAQYGSIRETEFPEEPQRVLVVAAGDHGVAVEGVSAYPMEVTVMMVKNYLGPKGAGANALANYAGATMKVADAGIHADMSDVEGLRHDKVAHGTKNLRHEPAMTEEECRRSMENGIRFVEEMIQEGYSVFIIGEMGIANTTSAAIITAKYANLPAEVATGKGSNISSERLALKTKIVAEALEKYRDIPTSDGFSIMRHVGGLEFAYMTGVILGAAAHHSLTIVDGVNATACALVAHAMNPLCMEYVLASHLSAEPAHIWALKHLGLEAYVKLGLCLGEATGALVQMGLFDQALSVYAELTKEVAK